MRRIPRPSGCQDTLFQPTGRGERAKVTVGNPFRIVTKGAQVKNARGFTLIELMIAVAIVGVLVAIAYPSYTNSLIKGNRAAAKAFLLEVVQKEQQFLLDNRAYGTKAELEAAGATAPKEVTNFYTWSVTPSAGPPPSFVTRVTPVAGKRQAPDGWLEVDQTGKGTSEKPDKW